MKEILPSLFFQKLCLRLANSPFLTAQAFKTKTRNIYRPLPFCQVSYQLFKCRCGDGGQKREDTKRKKKSQSNISKCYRTTFSLFRRASSEGDARLHLSLLGRQSSVPIPSQTFPLGSSKSEVLEFLRQKKQVGSQGGGGRLGLLFSPGELEFPEGKIELWIQGASEGAVAGGLDCGIEKR